MGFKVIVTSFATKNIFYITFTDYMVDSNRRLPISLATWEATQLSSRWQLSLVKVS